MGVILNRAISALPDIATGYHGAKVNAENGYITIIKAVPNSLAPQNDFALNGEILISDTRANVIAKYGTTLLSALTKYPDTNLKVVWSNEKITTVDVASIFKTNLVVRITEVHDAANKVTFSVLRNRYGVQQFGSTLTA
ncbi:MAG: hypothetical protein [Bacteriophage sp.]|nr:MAG: hypothetical protein [Bacteriophage sp.]